MMTAMKGSVVAWVKLMVRKNSAIATAAEEQLGGRVSNLRAIWALWYSMTLWIWVTLLAASWFNQFSQHFVLRMVFPDYPTSFCCRITGYDSIQMASPLPNIGTWWPWGGFVLVLHLAARGVPQLPEDTVWFHWGPSWAWRWYEMSRKDPMELQTSLETWSNLKQRCEFACAEANYDRIPFESGSQRHLFTG